MAEDERERLRELPLRLDELALRRVVPAEEPARDFPDDPDRELALLRDREGEDVRVAMLPRLRDRHRSPTGNTPPLVGSPTVDRAMGSL